MNPIPIFRALTTRFRPIALAGAVMAALLLLSSQAQAQITLQDGSPLTITDSGTGTTIVPVTVTAGASVLVVEVEDHGATIGSEPSTISWAGTNLTLGIEEDHTAGTTRGSAIYYLYNPPVGNAVNLTVTVVGGADDVGVTWFTLNGVNTRIAPFAVGANSGGAASLSATAIAAAGSWAVDNSTYATTGATPTVTGTAGTATTVVDGTANNSTTYSAGYISGLSAGTDTLTVNWNGTGANTAAQKANFGALVFTPAGEVQPPVTVTSVVPSPATPSLGQSFTVTANVTYLDGVTPSATATLNASSVNPSASAVALVQQSYNAATGLAVYTNAVTVSQTVSGGAKILTVVASDTTGDLNTNSAIVTVSAGIAVQDGGVSTLAHFATAVASENVLVTPGATALVVLFEDHGASPGKGEPSSVTWTVNGTNYTLTEVVETAHPQTTGRGAAIYYLYNPPVTAGTSLTVTGQGGTADCWMSWFTLSGVGTTTPPLVGSANTGANAAVSTLSFSIPSVPGGAFGVFNETYASTATSQSYTDNGVSAVYNSDTADGGSTAAGGYFNSLNPGTQNFVATWTAGTSVQKANFEAAVFLSPINISAVSATPSPGTSGQRESVSVTVSSSAGAIASVTAIASSIGGPASLPLNLSGTANVFTNSFVPLTNVFPTSVSLPFIVKDSVGNLVSGSISFILEGTNITWNGAATPNNTWAAGGNWVGGASPTLSSQVTFAGTTQTNVNMETSYTLSGLNFSANAGSFDITNALNSLNMESNSAIIDFSSNTETLGVPIQIGGALAITATNASGSVVFAQPISELNPGTGLLTITGPGTTVWTGANTFTGNTAINSGTLTIGPSGDLGDQGNGTGIYGGKIANNGTLNLFGTNAETLSGVISGSGPINISGGGTNNGPVVTLSGGNTFTGNLTLSNTYVSDTFADNNQTPTSSGLGNTATIGQTITINSNAILSLDTSNPLGNGSTLEQGTIIVNPGGVLQITAVNGNATVPAIVLNGGTMQAVGGTGFSQQYAALELGFGLTAGGPAASPSLITAVNSPGPNAVINLGVNTPAGYQSPWTVNLAGVNPSGAPDLTVAAGLINASDTQAATGLIKSGTGTMALTSPLNAYTGNTTINAGTLILADPGQLNGGTYAANIINNAAFISTTTTGQTLSGIISGTGSLTATGTGSSLTLSGVNTYSGSTILGPGATLFMSGAGSIANSSPIIISNTATLDVSADTSATDLAPGQSLYGNGLVNGAFITSATSGIFPGTDGTYGTNTFQTSLTLGAGATLDYDVGVVFNGTNDKIIVNGPLTVGNNVFIHFKAPSSSSSLDASGNDYVLIQATSISGNFATAPAFVLGSVPANGGNYSVVTDHTLNQVKLHFSTTASPLITSVSALPSSVAAYGSVFISVNVTPGAGSVTNVSVSLASLGGTSIQLVQQGSTTVYTNTVIIPPGAAPGTYNLTASATDTTPLSAAGNVSFVVVATTETWNGGGGGNQNWDTSSNWVSGLPPGYIGDSLVFAGTTELIPIMDNNYTVQSVTFSNNAGAFVITNANNTVLTFPANAGVTNNSTNVETFNLPVQLVGSVTLKSATVSDSLVFNQPIRDTSGSGQIVNAGGTNVLNGTNTYGGNTVIASGALTIGPGGDLGDQGNGTGGIYAANITNNGTFNFDGAPSPTGPQSFTGVLSGSGIFNIVGGGTNAPVVTLSGQSIFTNKITLTNSYVSVTGSAAGSQISGPLGNPSANGSITVNNGAILSFDATGGYELFPQNSAVPNEGLILNQGGIAQITASTTPVGPLTMNGGVLSIQTTGSTGTEPIQLSSAVTVGGTSPSLITNSPGIDGPGSGLNLGYFALVGNITFTVASTGSPGPDLIVAAPLANTSIDGGSVGGLLKAGAGTMELLDQFNTYTGSSTITTGTLILADPGQLNSGNYGAIVANSGTLIVSTTVGQTLSGVVSGTGTLIVETNQPATVAPTATLTLTAANTYSGSTIIGPGGDLVLQGSITNSSLIDVQSGGSFDVSALGGFTVTTGQTLRGGGNILLGGNALTINGKLSAGETNSMGTLTLDNSGLTLASGSTTSLRINKTAGGVKTNDMVAGISTANYAGTLTVTNTGVGKFAVGDSFPLFSATARAGNFSNVTVAGASGVGFSFSPANGNLSVTSVPPTTGTNLSFSVSGGKLNLSWPGYLGWILQSNSISLANSSAWFNVPGSSNVTSTNITITTNRSVFFRMVAP